MSQVEINDGSLTYHYKTVNIGGEVFDAPLNVTQRINDNLIEQIYYELLMDVLNERQQERNKGYES
jgi:hypothetical protein